jgi:DNA-binding NarL/FixJ family response regulator
VETAAKAVVYVPMKRAGARVNSTLGLSRRAWYTSGAGDLNLVARNLPDLVLLDLKMPDVSGPEFLEELSKKHPELPVVIVTGHPDGEFMTKATQYAPLMVLTKPVDQALMDRTVRVALGEGMAPPMVDGARNGGRP